MSRILYYIFIFAYLIFFCNPLFAVVVEYDEVKYLGSSEEILNAKMVSIPPNVSGIVSICDGSPTSLTASGGSGPPFQWFNSASGGTAFFTGSSYATPNLSGNVTYYVSSGTGTCVNFRTPVTVNVSPLPSAPIISSNAPVCNGAVLNLTANTIPGASYFWSGPTSFSFNLEDPVITSVTSSMAGIYSCSVLVGDCVSNSSVANVVMNNASVAPTGVTGLTTICSGGFTTLTVSGGSAGTGAIAVWYSASCGGTSIGTGNSITVSPSSNTTYFVRYSGVCNTTACASQLVTVNTNSVAPTGISGASTVCLGSSTTLTVTGGVLGTGAIIEWFTGSCGGMPIGVGNSISVSPTTNTIYYVRYSGTCNTTTCANTFLIVSPLDAANFTYANNSYCITNTDPVPSISGMPGGIFSVNNSGVINSSTGELDLDANGPSNYIVTYLTNGTCPNSFTYAVGVTSTPIANFSYPNSLYCKGGAGANIATVQLSTGASGGVFTDQGTTGNLTLNSVSGEVDLSSSQPGIYTVENNIAATASCPLVIATSMITIAIQEDADFSYSSASFCEGVANPNATILGTAGGSFMSVPNGLSLDVNTGEVDIASSTLDVTYTITYTTAGACFDSKDVMLSISSLPMTPTVTSSIVGNVMCEGDSIDLIASGSGIGVTYNIYDALLGGTLLGTADFKVSPFITTDYFVEAVNIAGCINTGARELITIVVNPLPSVDAGLDVTICPGDSVTLTASGIGTYAWSTLDVTQSINVTPIITTTYTVILTDANTCVNSDQVDINIEDVGTVLSAIDDSYDVDIETLTNLDILSNDMISNIVTTIILDPINGILNLLPDGSVEYTGNIGYMGADSLIYKVCEVNCPNICDTALVDIQVENSNFVIPGGFSPNDDNINDVFTIEGLSNYPDNHLQIFNRWGELVYSAQPYNNDWDGSSSETGVIFGEKVSTGTYFFILDIGSGSEVMKGAIEVKRN